MLGRWEKPFLTAFSDGDPITGDMAPILQALVPGAAGLEHPVLAGAGHFLQEDSGEELGRVVAAFVRQRPRVGLPVMTCSGPSTVVFDSRLTEYNFGPQHPMSPIRVDLTMRLADSLGLVGDGAGQLRMVDAPIADDELIATMHDASLIEAVNRMGIQPGPGEEQFGLGTDDNPVFLGMHEAAAHVVGASYEAFRQVWSGESLHSANIVGGLHHAMRDRASGFCIYNDIAVGIQWLLDQGARRSRTSMSTSTTATASSASSMTTRGC